MNAKSTYLIVFALPVSNDILLYYAATFFLTKIYIKNCMNIYKYKIFYSSLFRHFGAVACANFRLFNSQRLLSNTNKTSFRWSSFKSKFFQAAYQSIYKQVFIIFEQSKNNLFAINTYRSSMVRIHCINAQYLQSIIIA